MCAAAVILDTNSIEDHVSVVGRQVRRSLRDPEVERLARKIVRGRPDTYHEGIPIVFAWGLPHQLTLGEAQKAETRLDEIHAIWNFVVLNVSYQPDAVFAEVPEMVQTAELILDSRAGDCFPEGTLVLRQADGLVPIEEVEVGDFVHDGTSFVKVEQTWHRGPKPIIRADLNNGCGLRLSENHKLLRVPKIRDRGNDLSGQYGTEEELRFRDLKLGDDLLQPREFHGGRVELGLDDAKLVAAYLAEGYTSKNGQRIGLAGVLERKGVREELQEILTARGVHLSLTDREIRFAKSKVPIFQQYDLGRTALYKRFPHLDWGPQTVRAFFEMLERTDGGLSTAGTNCVYSSVSYELALQYRILARMMGYSTHLRSLENHGGAGKYPIHRVTRRGDHAKRVWARVKQLHEEKGETDSYDIMTATGRVYLPESDVIVRNCDDYTVLLSSLLQARGFTTKAVVVSTNTDNWEHIYTLVQYGNAWMPLDPVLPGALPGDEYDKYEVMQEFDLG